jgi:phospholipid/cholesterol/gamma-HCH transport system substrate-binding protein
VELRYRREAAVGVFLIVATLVFVLGLMWLRGQSLLRGEVLEVVFADVAGLKVGDPVRTSGVTVGTVKSIRLERPGSVVVQLELSHKQDPRGDAKATVRSLDFFGARYIDYQPGPAGTAFAAGQALPGELEPGFGEMAQDLSSRGREVLTGAAEMVGPQNNRELRAALSRAQRLLEEVSGSVGSGTREGVAALQSLRQVLQRIDLLLADPAAQQSLAFVRSATANLAEVTETLRHTTRVMDSLLVKVNSGRGTIGQLVNDTTLLAELRRTNRHLDSLVTDFMANPKKYINVHVF